MSNVEDSAARALAELGTPSAGKRVKADANDASDEPHKKRRRRTEQKAWVFPVQPNTIQVVKKPRTFVNHTYRDFSGIPADPEYEIPAEVSQKTFYQKIYDLLSMEGGKEKKSMEWCVHGRAFSVARRAFHDSSGILQSYFQHCRYNRFLKQLTNNGFKMITEGRDCGCFYSEFMLRGMPHLTMYAPEPVELRKTFPDPENEPDFYKISELFPLPGDRKDPREEAKAALAARGIIISDSAVTGQTGMTIMPNQGSFPIAPNMLAGFGGGLPFNPPIPSSAMGSMPQFLAPQYNGLLNGNYMAPLDSSQLNAALQAQMQAQAQLNLFRNQASNPTGSEEN